MNDERHNPYMLYPEELGDLWLDLKEHLMNVDPVNTTYNVQAILNTMDELERGMRNV